MTAMGRGRWKVRHVGAWPCRAVVVVPSDAVTACMVVRFIVSARILVLVRHEGLVAAASPLAVIA